MSLFGSLSALFSKKKKPKQKQQGAIKTAKSKRRQRTQPPKQKKAVKKIKKQAKPKTRAPKPISSQKQAAIQKQVESSLREAKAKAREIIVKAKDKALEIKAKAEKRGRNQENTLNQRGRALDKKIDKLDRKLDRIEEKETKIEQKEQKIEKVKKALKTTEGKMLARLEEISGLTEQEARQVILDGLEKKLNKELAQLIRQKNEEAKQEADDDAKKILVEAMRHAATDYVAEYTVSIVKIPSEDVKGKIIGKSGRNIHSFERETGVDLDLDYADTEVRISCFDPVRREIARISLEKLIKDGRIQPARIEKIVHRVKKEIDKIMLQAGKDLCQKVGVYNLPIDLVKILGRYKYRFSYGQSLISHTLEVTKIGTHLAEELGLDANVIKLGCLLHDIGKVSTNPEGSHVELGVKIANKFNMPNEVVKCIAQHHEDEPFSGPEQMLVYIADAISGARPGARYENLEGYIERLENLEKIATSHSEVNEAYAVKAGREIRVLLNPAKSKEDDVEILATKIRDKIQTELSYPGTVIVNVIRETRMQKEAK
ncbi:MAG: ribonuclease Y [Patescibacteria group bacterium]|nr:ribonuclease Y [Patescibacteria group bacterium]